MLLLLDNFDSFTFNLAHYFEALGQEVIVKRVDNFSKQQAVDLQPDYLVISPGPGTPADAKLSKQLIELYAGQIPILGVCLGHQCITELFGGRVVQAECILHGKTSLIKHNESGLFANCPNPMWVTRYHSLIAEKASLPDVLEVVATVTESQKEQETIMALRHKSLPVWGVQFHPESVLSEAGHQVLDNFLAMAPIDMSVNPSGLTATD